MGIPAARSDAIAAFTKYVKAPNKRDIKRSLRAEPEVIQELVSLAGQEVSIATIKRWVKKGDIPLRYRTYLIDGHFDASAKRVKLSRARRKQKKGRYWKISYNEWFLDNEQLTDSSLVQIISNLSTRKYPKGKKQLSFVGTVGIEFADDNIMRYTQANITIRATDKRVSVEAFGQEFRDFRRTVKSFANLLTQYLYADTTIEKISLRVLEKL